MVWLQGIFDSATPAILHARKAAPTAQRTDLILFPTRVRRYRFPIMFLCSLSLRPC